MVRSVRFLIPMALAWLAAACSDAPPTTPAAVGPALSAAGKADARDRYIVLFEDRVGQPANEAREMVRAHGGTLHFTYEHAVRGFAATLSPQAAEALRRNANVRHVEADGVVTLSATQTNAPWGLDRTDQRALPRSGTYTYTTGASGQGVNAYVVDTGIRFTHTQFGGRAVLGGDFVLDGMNGDDCIGHGTHVAGIVGGSTYGVAKAVKLHSVRIFDCVGNAYTSAVVAGLDWVRSNHVKPAVVNMSFNGPISPAQDDAVKALLTAGVPVVSSAGNDNADACEVSSGWIGGVITVGATDSTDARWWGSNWGHCMDVFAPGADIRSAMHYDDTYTEVLSGTSMAAPHVAGAVARFLQTKTSATPAEAHAFIVNNATTGVVSDAGLLSPNRVLYVDPALGTPPPTTGITGPGAISTAGTYTWQANAGGGTGAYTYKWEYRVQGSATWTAVGTASSYSRSVAAGNASFELRVTVTSGGLTASDTHLVSVAITPPPVPAISGPATITTAGTATWTASATGGNGTYTYAWESRVQGTTAWTAVGTGSSYSRSVASNTLSFELRVTVTSAGLTGTDTHLVSVAIPTQPSVTITGTTLITTAGTHTWTPSVLGGNGTNTYLWEYRLQGGTTWTTVGTASSYSRSVSATHRAFELRLTVTSGGLTATDTHLVSVNIPTPLAVSITGPTTLAGGTSGTWYANASGGSGSYTYQWQYRVATVTTWSNVNQTSSYTRTAPLFQSFYVRVTVTSGTASVSDEHYVTVESQEPVMCGNVYC